MLVWNDEFPWRGFQLLIWKNTKKLSLHCFISKCIIKDILIIGNIKIKIIHIRCESPPSGLNSCQRSREFSVIFNHLLHSLYGRSFKNCRLFLKKQSPLIRLLVSWARFTVTSCNFFFNFFLGGFQGQLPAFATTKRLSQGVPRVPRLSEKCFLLEAGTTD